VNPNESQPKVRLRAGMSSAGISPFSLFGHGKGSPATDPITRLEVALNMTVMGIDAPPEGESHPDTQFGTRAVCRLRYSRRAD
jgi:hypothetical protein